MVKVCKGIEGQAGLNESGFESAFESDFDVVGMESDCGLDTGEADEEGSLLSNVFFTADVKKAFDKYGIPEHNSKWIKRFALGQAVKKSLMNPLLYYKLKKHDTTYYNKEDYYQVQRKDE